MEINELLGRRALLKVSSTRSYWGGEISEYKIKEISPSGNWVKLQNIYGNQYWKAIQEISLVEVLIDFEKHPL